MKTTLQSQADACAAEFDAQRARSTATRSTATRSAHQRALTAGRLSGYARLAIAAAAAGLLIALAVAL